MNLSEKSARLITDVFVKHAESLPYAKIDANGVYKGWATDFSMTDNNGNLISLNLKFDRDKGFESIDDLFLLFSLASVWSRSGVWENAAYFTAYLKLAGKASPAYWLDVNNVENEELIPGEEKISFLRDSSVSYIKDRRKISFRSDLYKSLHVLASAWGEIVDKLMLSSRNGDYISFIKYLREIKGLGSGNKRMLIKIPLILRELRCQNFKDNVLNIPGELCCVPDQRVIKAIVNMNVNGLDFPRLPYLQGSVDNLIKSSSLIYKYFGDLYDLPLFAYDDLVDAGHL